MAKTTQRAFALSLAILFTITTVGFTGLVIWQMTQESKINNEATTAQQAQQQAENNKPKDFMKDFKPLGNERITALKVETTKEGSGQAATADSTVKVTYTGALAKDGSIFDSTDSRGGDPAEFPLSGVITGFKEGITGMKIGESRRIFIPAEKGYGAQGGGSIPADSDLVFDVTLVSIK